MPNFEVRVRLLDIDEHDAWSARQAAEERLRAAGFRRWQLVGIRLQDAPRAAVAAVAAQQKKQARKKRRSGESSLAGGLVLVVALAWSFWFWWAVF